MRILFENLSRKYKLHQNPIPVLFHQHPTLTHALPMIWNTNRH